MHADDVLQLRDLVTKSREELQTAVGNYERLLSQLDQLERTLESGALHKESLIAAEKAFWAFPRLAVLRAASPTDEGLDDTRALLIEIQNRIVILEEGPQGEGGGGGQQDSSPGE